MNNQCNCPKTIKIEKEYLRLHKNSFAGELLTIKRYCNKADYPFALHIYPVFTSSIADIYFNRDTKNSTRDIRCDECYEMFLSEKQLSEIFYIFKYSADIINDVCQYLQDRIINWELKC